MNYVLITAARNEAAMIKATIESVVAQTVRPVRWVIVDDGSTDGTSDIVEAYLSDHEWIELLRRPLEDEVEFITIMRFTSLQAVKAFAGQDHETAYVPPAARAVLQRFDAQSQHYEVREERMA